MTGCWGSPELNSAVDNLNVPKVSAFGMKMLQGLHQEPYGEFGLLGLARQRGHY